MGCTGIDDVNSKFSFYPFKLSSSLVIQKLKKIFAHSALFLFTMYLPTAFHVRRLLAYRAMLETNFMLSLQVYKSESFRDITQSHKWR